MKVPLEWLSDYISFDLPPSELAHRLTMAGIESTYEPGPSSSWSEIYIGKVIDIEPHPNADRLRLATVAVDDEPVKVVCGAPNLQIDQRVAFAQVGALLLNPSDGELFTLKAAKIRGVVSEGMICSERELGISDEHEGILVLPESAPIGTPLSKYLRDDHLNLELTSNRGDCLSILGVAREVAAIVGDRILEPPNHYSASGPNVTDSISIDIEDPKLCERYLATVIRNVTIKDSPHWMQQRLIQAGLRPINNVVDITNYVMLELGQPLHAFDLRSITNGSIIVRSATEGEIIETLDGQSLELDTPMLLIADHEKAIGLAGIMGGANSEMSASTTNILIEAATFNGTNTRRTSQKLKVRSEASNRFEKHLNPELAFHAIKRASYLILELAGGIADEGIAESFPGKSEVRPITLRRSRIKQVLGIDLPPDQIASALLSLGLQVIEANSANQDYSNQFSVLPPYWRSDIAIEDDLVEEVARSIGYDAIPPSPLNAGSSDHVSQPIRELREDVRDFLVSSGLQETISYSLVSDNLIQASNSKSNHLAEPLKVATPMSQEQEYLRLSLRGSVLKLLGPGLRQSEGPLGLFEIGRVYYPQTDDLPREQEMVFCAQSGNYGTSLWENTETSIDFFDAKGIVETALLHLGITPQFEAVDDSFFHPGRCATIHVNGNIIGVVGELHPEMVDSFEIIAQKVACFELDLQLLLEVLPNKRHSYAPFSRYPSADRDIALIVDRSVTSEELKSLLEDDPLVRDTKAFDVFTGGSLPTDKKSIAFRIRLQSHEKTLSSEEVNVVMATLISRLGTEFGATLRS